MSAVFSVAGGVRYHLRALRHSRDRWRPFRDELHEWLRSWRASGDTLLIVGASGGYCLRMDWLKGFDHVICLDPDPLARIIFSRRLRAGAPKTRLTWSNDDFLKERSPERQLSLLREFISLYPDAPVLFCNFLGQLRLLQGEHGHDVDRCMAAWKASLVPDVLAGRSWASFHDRVSGELSPGTGLPFRSPERVSDEEIARAFYPAHSLDKEVVLVDHDTERLFPRESEHAYFSWELRRGWAHLIEATRAQ